MGSARDGVRHDLWQARARGARRAEREKDTWAHVEEVVTCIRGLSASGRGEAVAELRQWILDGDLNDRLVGIAVAEELQAAEVVDAITELARRLRASGRASEREIQGLLVTARRFSGEGRDRTSGTADSPERARKVRVAQYALFGALLGMGKVVEVASGDWFLDAPAWLIVPGLTVLCVMVGFFNEFGSRQATWWRAIGAAMASVALIGVGTLLLGAPATIEHYDASLFALALAEVVGVPVLLYVWRSARHE